jgi:hypothetical protein
MRSVAGVSRSLVTGVRDSKLKRMRQKKNAWEPRSGLVLWFREDLSFRGHP